MRHFYDYKFGNGAAPWGTARIADAPDLALDCTHWTRDVSGETATINTEVKRCVEFSHAENFVFEADTLKLTPKFELTRIGQRMVTMRLPA